MTGILKKPEKFNSNDKRKTAGRTNKPSDMSELPGGDNAKCAVVVALQYIGTFLVEF